jgi:hypothetical protein
VPSWLCSLIDDEHHIDGVVGAQQLALLLGSGMASSGSALPLRESAGSVALSTVPESRLALP